MYPIFEPYDSGHFPVSDIHHLYYEQVGNPRGRAVLFLHGGPGGGIFPAARRFFDPLFYRLVSFDQRGSGQSLPYAAVEENTTQDLINDIEELRKDLGIESWIVFWWFLGGRLSLLPMLLLTQRGLMLWFYVEYFWVDERRLNGFMGPNGAARLFPTEYERFSLFIKENGN